MMKSLILGCGYVGSALAELLAHTGGSTWAVCRSPRPLPATVSGLWTDIGGASLKSVIPTELNYVFFTAAPDSHDEGSYRRIYLDALAHSLDSLQQCAPRLPKFILASSTSVYGQNNGEWVAETSETKSQSFAGQVLLESERLVLNSAFPAIVVRFGGIYGPGRESLLTTIQSGSFKNSENTDRFTNRIHRDDCARALVYLAQHGTPGEIYNAVDDEPATLTDIATWFSQADVAIEPAPDKPSRRSRVTNKRCSNKKLHDAGFSFTYPTYREGYGSLLGLNRK